MCGVYWVGVGDFLLGSVVRYRNGVLVMIMKVLRSEVLSKLEEWSPEDFDGCRGVWMEKHSLCNGMDSKDESFEEFCMTVAAQNVLFDKIMEES